MTKADVYDYAATRLPDEWKSTIDFFWEGFTNHADAIDRYFTDSDESVDPAEMTIALLKALPTQLLWEYGSGEAGGHRLTITSELNSDAHVLARAVMNRAPELPRWSFSDARSAENDPDFVRQAITVRTFTNDLAISGISFAEGYARTINVVAHASMPDTDASLAAGQGEMFMSAWLGEYGERLWLGEFLSEQVFYPKKKFLGRLKLSKPLDVAAVGGKLDALIASLKEKSPMEPWSSVDLENASWASMNGNPKGEDFLWRDDTIAAISAYADVTLASLQGDRFRSERFSRHGETFCFLKIDGSEDDPIGRFEDRDGIEIALNELLQPSGLGAAIGGATGARYTYIDLALVDLENSIEAVCSLLREGNLTRRAWLHFNDDGLDDFWVPVWPDAPAPPLRTRH